MLPNLTDYHLQIRCHYTFKIFSLSLRVTTREAAIVITQNIVIKKAQLLIWKYIRTKKKGSMIRNRENRSKKQLENGNIKGLSTTITLNKMICIKKIEKELNG